MRNERKERLTTNKSVSEMGMYELAHNCCHSENGKAMYRDFSSDTDARHLARKLMVQYGHWDSCDDGLVNDDVFDNIMRTNLMYGINENIGLIAVFYRNLWAMADLYERLKEYEDAEDDGILLKLPYRVGDIVFIVKSCSKRIYPAKVLNEMRIVNGKLHVTCKGERYTDLISCEDLGKKVFLTKEEAEQKLKEMMKDEHDEVNKF